MSGAPAGSFVEIASGANHSCVRDADGDVACWGHDFYGQATPPGEPVSALALGGDQSCAIHPEGHLECWGDGESRAASLSRVQFPAQDVGVGHVCRTGALGSAVCWGETESGPSTPLAGPVLLDVAAGGDSSCGSRVSGLFDVLPVFEMSCWGSEDVGKTTPPALVLPSIDLAVGFDHAGAVESDGTLACWGRDLDGESSPPAGTYARVSTGLGFSCALRASNGTIVCWGQSSIATLPPAGAFTEIASGQAHSCGNGAPDQRLCDPFQEVLLARVDVTGVGTAESLLPLPTSEA